PVSAAMAAVAARTPRITHALCLMSASGRIPIRARPLRNRPRDNWDVRRWAAVCSCRPSSSLRSRGRGRGFPWRAAQPPRPTSRSASGSARLPVLTVRIEARQGGQVAWIKTIPKHLAEGALREAYLAQERLYPKEYDRAPGEQSESIVPTHSLIPDALFHAF